MTTFSATASAHPNIAFIKYWGNRDDNIRLPVNGSISMNLSGLYTRTTVTFLDSLPSDDLIINDRPAEAQASERVRRILDELRSLACLQTFAHVESWNNFPLGAGIASSASAFASLALAGSQAAGLKLNEANLSRLARHGSGSACRSIAAGFVEWKAGTNDTDSFAESIAPQSHWDLVDCIVLVDKKPKSTGSAEGNQLAITSPLQTARVQDAPRRLSLCRDAILNRDFSGLASIVEEDSNLMHAVMMTSHPPLFYWQPDTLGVMQAVRAARQEGLPVCYTVDAGPNVHVISAKSSASEVKKLVESLPGVQEVLIAGVGGPALLEDPTTGSGRSFLP